MSRLAFRACDRAIQRVFRARKMFAIPNGSDLILIGTGVHMFCIAIGAALLGIANDNGLLAHCHW